MKYTRVYEGGSLSGYRCEKGYIEVRYYGMSAWGDWHKEYIVNGHGYDRLCDAKKELEGRQER